MLKSFLKDVAGNKFTSEKNTHKKSANRFQTYN